VNRFVASGATLTININYQTQLIPIAKFENEFTLEETSTMEYIVKVTLTFSTENTLRTDSTMEYNVLESLAYSTENTLLSSASMEYITLVSNAYSNEYTLAPSASINYNVITDYVVENEYSLVSSSTINYEVYPNFDGSWENDLQSLANMNYTVNANPSPVEWVIVQSGTVTGGECILTSDIGNIKEETTTSCSFVNNGSTFISSTDLSEPQPACGTGITYTVCFPELDQNLNPTGDYVCQEKIGTTTSNTTKYECQLK
jgi:hypothetical protein